MSAPITGEMKYEMNWNTQGENCPIWKSPIGHVVPFKDFQRYTQIMMQKYSDAQDMVFECTEELKRGTGLFDETTDYIEKRYLTNAKEMRAEMILFRIAFIVASIVAVSLGIALAVILV